ncbi:MAG: DUF2254 domain-containing protein [Methylococcaceae bacterium]|jgi:uncharacterized membrane protein
MRDRFRFILNRINEKLWVKPLLMCIASTILVFVAKAVDNVALDQLVPIITQKSIETLLSIISASMLVISTFALSSMVAAYNSASTTATPRSFPLIIADDVSQNALSTFIGSFIFSIVGLVALQNSFYDKGGRFVLFALTITLFAIVIITFVRWVDRIARLGRLGTTIEQTEAATLKALRQRRGESYLNVIPAAIKLDVCLTLYAKSIGYVQRVDVFALQKLALETQTQIVVTALPGTFAAPGQALAFVTTENSDLPEMDTDIFIKAFQIGNDRKFDEDPRFGLIALSEIASRALSPAMNDPGTAIAIIGSLVRLFSLWVEPTKITEEQIIKYDRVIVPDLSMYDMFEDAFTGIARDGAGIVEVAVRLQKAFVSLATIGDESLTHAAIRHSHLALARAEMALSLTEDKEVVRQIAKLVNLTTSKPQRSNL